MFVQDFMIIDKPSSEIVALLQGEAGSLLGEAVEAAGAGLDHLRLKVAPGSWPTLLAKQVEVRLGPVRRHGEVTLIAFTWSATGPGSLFPALDADLEVSPLGEERSEVALHGRYDPPGGGVGRGMDRLLLNRLANATVRAFLSNLAERLAETAAAASS